MPSARKRATERANHRGTPAEQAAPEPHTTQHSPQTSARNDAHNATDSAAARAALLPASSSPSATSPRVPAWWEGNSSPLDTHQLRVRAALKGLNAASEPFAELLQEVQLLAERLADLPRHARTVASLTERLAPIAAGLHVFVHYSTAAGAPLAHEVHFGCAALPVLLQDTLSQIQPIAESATAFAVGAEAFSENLPSGLMTDIRRAASTIRDVAHSWDAIVPRACESILACKDLVPDSAANALEAQLLQLRQFTGSQATSCATDAVSHAMSYTPASESQVVPSAPDASSLLGSILQNTSSMMMADVQRVATRTARGTHGAANQSMPQCAHVDKTSDAHSRNQSFEALEKLQAFEVTAKVLAACSRRTLPAGHSGNVAAKSLSASAQVLGSHVFRGHLSLTQTPRGSLPPHVVRLLAVSTSKMAECTAALEATTVGRDLIPQGWLAANIKELSKVAHEMAQLFACWPVEGPPNTRTPGAAGTQQSDAGTSIATATSLRAAHGGAVALPCAELLASSEQQTSSPAAAARQGLCKRVVQICIHLHNAPASEVTCGMRSGAALHTLARAVCVV